jgi:hypothetical protein
MKENIISILLLYELCKKILSNIQTHQFFTSTVDRDKNHFKI